MPATVVVGGQYGSEGKGKVVHYIAAESDAGAVIRVGGPNSGHTSFAADGGRQVLRQLPVGALLPDPLCLLGPGSYVDPKILLAEIDRLGLGPERVRVDYRAMAVAPVDREAERAAGLGDRIGSTCSGTGSAVSRRIARTDAADLVTGTPELHGYLADTVEIARDLLSGGRRVIIEGTQGFGLSLLQGPHYPNVTSRDTSAAAALAEAGLSPRDVDDVTMVLRAHPIRVAGNSGPFDAEEIDWETVRVEGGLAEEPTELTSVTGRVRRVARFEATIVRRAILANRPSRIVLNHLDYVDAECARGSVSERAAIFARGVEEAIGQPLDLLGCGPHPGDLIATGRDASLPAL
jgi:adenylosuccinate synthase